MLLSGAQRDEIEKLSERIIKIETATEARFQELFVAAMAFPHETAPSPHLAQVVDLPGADDGRSPEVTAGTQRRRRRVR